MPPGISNVCIKAKIGVLSTRQMEKSIFGQISKISRFLTHVTNFGGIHRVPKNGEQVFLLKLVKNRLDLPLSKLQNT